MDEDIAIKMECVARVMAMAAVIHARVEGMKAANAERARFGDAAAYPASEFFNAERELTDFYTSQIGAE
jgi:hypothetical protein